MATQRDPMLDTLYAEAVSLADRARAWFDGPGLAWRQTLPIEAQAAVATESLGTTARLMAVMSWLLDPAHEVGRNVPRLVADTATPLPESSPLAGTPGADIARGARALAARVAVLTPRSPTMVREIEPPPAISPAGEPPMSPLPPPLSSTPSSPLPPPAIGPAGMWR